MRNFLSEDLKLEQLGDEVKSRGREFQAIGPNDDGGNAYPISLSGKLFWTVKGVVGAGDINLMKGGGGGEEGVLLSSLF